jgi:hypothetical protein
MQPIADATTTKSITSDSITAEFKKETWFTGVIDSNRRPGSAGLN